MDRIVKELNNVQSLLHWGTFAGLIAIALILRLAAFQGYSASDPRVYAELADDLAHGTLHIPDYEGLPVFPLRLGVYAPTAALIKVFGLSEVTLAAYPFLVSLAGCLLVYALGRRLGTPLAGLIGLGSLAVLPIDVSMASLLYPDAIAAFWANVGIALACIALDKSKLRHSALLGALSGACFGVSWLCKEAVVYLVPFVASLVFVLPRQSRFSGRAACIIAIGVGSIAVILAETVFYAKLTGDPLFRLHATERNYVQAATWFFDASSPIFGWDNVGYARALVKRLFLDGPRDMFLSRSLSLVPTLAILGAAWAVVIRQRLFVIATIWLTSLLLMFNFMTTSFNSYKPLPLFDRYLYPIVLPSLVLMGSFLATLLAADSDQRLCMERRFWAVVLIVSLCGISSIGVWKGTRLRPGQVERNVAVRLEDTDVVYTDSQTAGNLIFFRTGRLLWSTATTIAWERVDLRDVPTGSYILVNRDEIDFLTKSYKYESPSLVTRPPSTWERVWAYGNAALYVVAAK